VFLFIVRELQKICGFPAPPRVVGHKQLLNPAATLFDQPPDWAVLNTLRSVAIDMAFRSGPKTVFGVLGSCTGAPHLFAEIMYRFMPLFLKSGEKSIAVPTLRDVALRPMAYYQSFSDLDEAAHAAVSAARVSLFVLLDGIMKRDDMLPRFMEDRMFAHEYLSLVFELPTRPIVMESIGRFMAIWKCQKANGFSEELVHFLVDLSSHFSDARALTLLQELLAIVNGAMASNKDTGEAFAPGASRIVKRLFRLQASDLAVSFMSEFMSFLVHTARWQVLESMDASAMTAVVQRMWGDDPPDSFYFQLVQWAAGNHTAHPDTPFQVCQAQALAVLLSAFHNSHHLTDIFTLVESLVHFSESNCQAIHESGIDIALLGIPQKWRTRDCVDNATCMVFLC